MLIGKAGAATTSISTADAGSLTVRGRDLCGDLMGRLSFTEYFHLLVTGREATEDAAVLPRPAAGGDRRAWAGADQPGGADDLCRRSRRAAGGGGGGDPRLRVGGAGDDGGLRDVPDPGAGAGAGGAEALVAGIRDAGGKVPGFGHPLHKPVDPRAQRIMALAEERGAAGPHLALARQAEAVVPRVWGKALPMNVSMPIAAVLLDLDFPPAMLKGDPDPGADGLAAGASGGGERAADRLPDGGGGRGGHGLRPGPVMRDPAVETMPWAAQAGGRRGRLSGAGRLSVRALGVLPGEAGGGGISRCGERGRARRDRARCR